MADARTLAMALTGTEADLLRAAVDHQEVLTIDGGIQEAACRQLEQLELLGGEEVTGERREVFRYRWTATDLGRRVAAVVGWA